MWQVSIQTPIGIFRLHSGDDGADLLKTVAYARPLSRRGFQNDFRLPCAMRSSISKRLPQWCLCIPRRACSSGAGMKIQVGDF